MYFTNPIKKFEERSSGLMSTHPAIIDRINRLRELTGEPPLGASEAAAAGRAGVGGSRGRVPFLGLLADGREGPWYPATRRRAADGWLAIGPR